MLDPTAAESIKGSGNRFGIHSMGTIGCLGLVQGQDGV